MNPKTKRIKLDWTKLVGFNQVPASQRLSSAKTMVGGKPTAMVGAKLMAGVKAV